MKKVYLIRHGQAVHNISGDVSILDPELTSLGKEQCEQFKSHYLDVTFVISSTAQRALETATQLFPSCAADGACYKHDPSTEICATDLLLEYNTGVPCNKRVDLETQQKLFPHVDFDKYKVAELPIELTWNDGNIRATRIIELLKSIDANVIGVVSHANIIRNIISLLDKYKAEELGNCDAYIVHI